MTFFPPKTEPQPQRIEMVVVKPRPFFTDADELLEELNGMLKNTELTLEMSRKANRIAYP